MKLPGLTIDSSLSFIAHIKSVCNKVNVTVSALEGIRKFIPPEAMVNIYKAFILPHREYRAPVLVGLSTDLSNKLELTNQCVIRTLLIMAQSTSYSDLLTYVGLKTLEHRRYSNVLSPFFFTNACTIWGPIMLRRCSYFVIMNTTSEALQGYHPTYKSRFMHWSYHYIISRLRNNLLDYVRRAPSLNIFMSMLVEVNLITGV